MHPLKESDYLVILGVTFGTKITFEKHLRPVFDGAGLADFKSRANGFFFTLAARYLIVFYCFPFLFFYSMGWYFWSGVFVLIRCLLLSPSVHCQPLLMIMIKAN